jgi:hypothetical protein
MLCRPSPSGVAARCLPRHLEFLHFRDSFAFGHADYIRVYAGVNT